MKPRQNKCWPKKILALAVAGAAFLLVSCAGLLGPRNVEVPLPKLQEAMVRKFPFNSRFLDLFDIRVANPHLSLDPGTNRIVTSMDASISPPFMQKSWKGNFTLSSLLKIDPVRGAILLDEPRMENMAIDGLSGPYASQIAKAGALLAEQLLKDMPIYTFDPQEFSYGGMRFLPTKINTTANGLVVTFEPAR